MESHRRLPVARDCAQVFPTGEALPAAEEKSWWGSHAAFATGGSYGLAASDSRALRAQSVSDGQRFRRWITTGNVPGRSSADRPNKLIDNDRGAPPATGGNVPGGGTMVIRSGGPVRICGRSGQRVFSRIRFCPDSGRCRFLSGSKARACSSRRRNHRRRPSERTETPV